MPNRPIDTKWRQAIFHLMGDDEGRTAATVERELRQIAPKLRLRVPSPRTIARIQEEWRLQTKDERDSYRVFFWPESMQTGELEWEASPYALELLRERQKEGAGRPRLSSVRWFWRVSLAAPTADYQTRASIAGYFAALEELGAEQSDRHRAAEWLLAFAPWQSDEYAKAYEDARLRADDAHWSWDAERRLQGTTQREPEVIDAFEPMIPFSEDLDRFFTAFDASGNPMTDEQKTAFRRAAQKGATK